MPYQNVAKYALPAFAVVLLLLVAAWMFNLPPVSALTQRDDAGASANPRPVGQSTKTSYDLVQVSGAGTATGAPDLAKLSLSVSVTADTVAEARNTAATAMDDVRASITDNDIDEDDIATSHFRIHPEYDYGPDGRTQTGYTVSNGLLVTVRTISDVGAVIDDAVTAGGDNIVFNNLDFQISDTAALERAAREAAVADLQATAEQIAEFSDRELGDLKVVSESPIGDIGGPALQRAFAASESAAFDTPISAGQDTITVVVYGVYQLLD